MSIYLGGKNIAGGGGLTTVLEENIVDGQVTRSKLSNVICGRDFEVNNTKAYPGISFTVNNAPKGKNITIKCKITTKNTPGSIRFTYNYGGAYQDNNFADRPLENVEKVYEYTWENTSDRAITSFFIGVNSNNPSTNLNALIKEVRLYIDGKEHFDFVMQNDTGITDLTDYSYTLASRLYVKEHTDKAIKALQDNFKYGDKTIHYNALNEDIVGNCFYIHKISAYPGIKFNLSLKIHQGQRVQLAYKVKVVEGDMGHFCAFNYHDGSYNDLHCKSTEIGKVQEVKSNVIEFSTDKTIIRVSIAKNNNSPNDVCHQYIYDPCIVVDGVRYPLTEDMLVEDSNALTLQSIKEEAPLLATKKFVEDSINTALNGIEKREFVLPFVNNLYVVQGSKRKQSVPIFIDYLYNGNKDKILFENGEDRVYIREARLSPDSQPASILNTKETLKFKSETLDVQDVTFNKISIEEKTPNGKIRLLTIGDSVTAGAITEKQYWAVARELFALEDIDRNRNSDVMFLGSNNVRNTTINYNGVEKQVKSCACGISSWSLNHWLTNSSSHFVYDNNGTPVFSILKWIERYRTHLDDGTKLELGDSRLGTEITSSNIDNIQCCTPNIVYINSTHNGGSIEEHEQMIEIIQREIPGCKIIVGSPMPLTGTWHKEKYVGKDWLDSGVIIGPNYSWGGDYGNSRIKSLKHYTQRERENADNTFYFMPQVVTMPTVEALEYDLVDCGVKMMKQPTKVNQLPKEHPGTLAHKIWGYELYALLKYISGIEQGVTNNFNEVPLFDNTTS